MNFGIIFYPESVTVVLCDRTQVYVREYPASWDYFYGDFFIIEDWWDTLLYDDEEARSEDSFDDRGQPTEVEPHRNYPPPPPGSRLASFWDF